MSKGLREQHRTASSADARMLKRRGAVSTWPRLSAINRTGRISMTSAIGLPLLAAVALAGLAAAGPAQAQQASMTFFVTSVGKGNGADLGGPAGADPHCPALANAAGSTNAKWRPYR